MAFVYGDLYCQCRYERRSVIENQAMLNAGFKTGDKIISVDGKKKKFDNDINMKVVLEKTSEKKPTEIKCLLILSINCLNLKRTYWTSEPFVIGAVTDESTNKFYKPKML
jgi:regulator of sigma E protease